MPCGIFRLQYHQDGPVQTWEVGTASIGAAIEQTRTSKPGYRCRRRARSAAVAVGDDDYDDAAGDKSTSVAGREGTASFGLGGRPLRSY